MTITPNPDSWEQFYDLEPLDPPPDPMAPDPEPDPEPEPDMRVTLEDGTPFYVYGSTISVSRESGLIHFTLYDPETGRSIVALTHDYGARRLARDILTETEKPR